MSWTTMCTKGQASIVQAESRNSTSGKHWWLTNQNVEENVTGQMLMVMKYEKLCYSQ
jgi:hypothetical protein